MKIAVISCTKLKNNYSCEAKEMYMKSALFKKASKYVDDRYDKWFILSAKYGLLEPNQVIDSYDETLNNMKYFQIKNWSKKVFSQLDKFSIDQIDFYAGDKYRKYLIPLLEDAGIKCNIPLKSKGIGEQLKFYKDLGI